MHLHEITFLTVVSLLEFLQSAENSKHGFTDFTSQNYRRNENQHGRLIFYRPIRNNYQYQEEQYYNRHQENSGRIPYQSNRETNRFTPKNEYTRWNRIQTNVGPNSYKQFDKRLGYDYTNNFNTPRKQKLQYDREESIADYVKRFNFENNNPQAEFYNGPNDSTYNQPIEEEIFIEEEPDNYKHLVHNFQSSNNFPKDLHQDLRKATFQKNEPSPGISSFSNKHHFSAGRNPIQEEHKHFYYDKPDYDQSDDNSDDKDIDPELFAIYKKVIEAYKKKQKQKKQQGNKGFYFGNQEKNKPLIFQQQNEQSDLKNGKNHFHESSNDGHSSIFPMPRHPNRKGFVFPGPVKLNNRHPNPYMSFQASPQFHKYSEPDPLYHPNGNPFEFHNTSPSLPPTSPQVTTASSITQSNNFSQLSTTEKSKDFPDSINAQLPPPEKDADTNIPYVAATVLTPKTTLETSTTLTTDSHALLTEFVSLSSTGKSLTATLNSKNENSKLYNKLISTHIANVTSSVASDFNAGSDTVTPEFETVSATISVTEQPELYFLPTAAEDISGSSSKEMPILEATVKILEDPNKPTTYRRNFNPPATAITEDEISTPSIITQNEANISNYSLSPSYITEYPYEMQNIKLDKIINKKEDHILHKKYVEDKRHDDKHIPSYASSVAMQDEVTDVLPTAEATTVECKNTTAMNVISNYTEHVPLSNHLPNKNEERSEITSEKYVKKSIEYSTPKKDTTKEKLTTSVKQEGDYGFPTNITDEIEYHLKPPKTYKLENNIHYIMSIINQARSHVILSQNDSQVDDVLH